MAGFIPQTGKSVLDYSQMDATSLLPPSLQLSEDQTLAGIVNPEVNLTKIFAQDATDAQKQFLVSKYKAEPTIPLGTPLTYKSEDYNLGGKNITSSQLPIIQLLIIFNRKWQKKQELQILIL